nr:MAG TPA: hypothetical protein [Caudoviricetes sp.]
MPAGILMDYFNVITPFVCFLFASIYVTLTLYMISE